MEIDDPHGVPAMAASIRLLVGLGGSDSGRDGASSCSGNLVLLYLMTFGPPFTSTATVVGVGWYGDSSASGGNMSALRV